MAKNTYLKKVLGEEKYNELQKATVLMVGAGGIGCELLKDLMLSGYGTIHIVDLDTITLSNLNRQFLFRQKDIDKSKSLTIKRAVQGFNYQGTELVSHHGNIMDTEQFPVEWWSQFTYIFNALDNLEARRYVNKIALFLRKPVLESGTTGYDGYVQPIFPYQSECFECQPKATPQTFPVCTIRSTPSKPIHCITWAKEFLFQQLFDEQQQQQLAEELSKATDDAKELENLMRETNELVDLRKMLISGDPKFFEEMYKKIFITDIERLLLIDTLWSNRTKPSPLSVDLLGKISKKELDDTKVWDVLDNLCSLSAATAKLQNRIAEESFISFDKDDEETLDFVVCAANLRSSIFSIDILSKFDIKQIAGNIIPAIATTNAIISGFSNLESLNYLRESKLSDAAMVFISIRPNKYVTSASLEQPRDTCGSCSIARGIVSISEGSLSSSLESFVDKIKETYLYGDISLILGNSKLIYDFDFEDNLEKNLTEIGFNKGETIQIQDEDDELETLELLIDVRESKQKEGITLPTLTLRPKVIRQAEEDKVDGETNGDIIDSGEVFDTIVIDDEQEGEKIEEVEEGEEVQEPIQKKRRVD